MKRALRVTRGGGIVLPLESVLGKWADYTRKVREARSLEEGMVEQREFYFVAHMDGWNDAFEFLTGKSYLDWHDAQAEKSARRRGYAKSSKTRARTERLKKRLRKERNR